MNLSKEDALVLIKLLTLAELNVSTIVDPDDRFTDLMDRLESFVLTGDPIINPEPDNGDDDVLYDDEEGSGPVEVLYSDLCDLPRLNVRVVSSAFGEPEDKVVLKFTEHGDVVITDHRNKKNQLGTISGITDIERGGSSLVVTDDHAEQHRFHVDKFSTEWTSLLPVNVSHDVI